VTPQRSEGVAVTALGMMTPLGRNAVVSCAAARAGITRVTELTNLDFSGDAVFGDETMGEVPAVSGAIVRGIGDTYSGMARALMLGGPAIDEILESRPLTDDERARTGFVLNLSDHFVLDADARAHPGEALPSVAWRRQTESLQARLAGTRKLAPAPGQRVLRHGGNAGLAAGIQDATALIASNTVDRCIVGAIDSRAEAGFLQAAARLRLLRTVDNPVGLTPGEAAAFLLLERPRDAARGRHPVVAMLATNTIGASSTDLLAKDWPASGGEFADVLRAALITAPSVAFSIGDLNGTERRAVEWGNALVLLGAQHGFPSLPTWFPALSFGDTGAASGAVGLCVAARAFARRYAPGGSCLVWLSSESGAKSAIVVQSPSN
jgi:3-oxoacyl-[acyl-carrier-protein] synthase-1